MDQSDEQAERVIALGADLKADYEKARSLLRGYRDARRKTSWFAANHIYDIHMPIIRRGGADTAIMMLSNDQPGLQQELEGYFGKKLGYAPSVIIEKFPGGDRALSRFRDLKTQRMVNFDTAVEFLAWEQAVKGTKLVYGCGVFYRVTGGRTKDRQVDDSPMCRNCDSPYIHDTGHLVDPDQTVVEVSSITGQKWRRVVAPVEDRYAVPPNPGRNTKSRWSSKRGPP